MSKTIVLCCDGTNNQMTGHETNVLHTYRALVRDEHQLTFYDPGVGTLADPMALTRTRKFIQRALDASIGRSLCQNFSDAYRFLVRHYQAGDDIVFFGFSRGAYTARAVAGAIHMLGLVRPELEHLSPYVWAIYANDGGAYDVRSRFGGAHRFKEMFCIPQTPQIRLMALWDTVSSFGWFWDFQSLPYTSNNPSISLVRHAISIDERRAAFPANFFRDGDGKPVFSEEIKQVCFAGVHSDVGGGYPDSEAGLAKIALRWMVTEAGIAGVRFDESVLNHILGCDGLHSVPDPAATLHRSLRAFWHLMEWLPRRRWYKTADESTHHDRGATAIRQRKRSVASLWVKHWVFPHFYRRRNLPDGIVLHPSVQERENLVKQYRPKLPQNSASVDYLASERKLPEKRKK